MPPFIVTTLLISVAASVINLATGLNREHGKGTHLRFAASALCLVPILALLVITKAGVNIDSAMTAQNQFIVDGILIGLTLMLPSALEKSSKTRVAATTSDHSFIVHILPSNEEWVN